MRIFVIAELSDPSDWHAARAFFGQHAAQVFYGNPPPPESSTSPPTPGGPAEKSLGQELVENVWLRVGKANRRLLKAITVQPSTIETLALRLNRSPTSVRSSMNAALKRAINSAMAAVPGAPDLLVWKKRPDRKWEVSYTSEIAAIFGTKTVDDVPPSPFDEVPHAGQ